MILNINIKYKYVLIKPSLLENLVFYFLLISFQFLLGISYKQKNIKLKISSLLSISVILILFNSCTKNADGTVTIIPIAPNNLKATTFSTTAINLTWTDNSTNEDGFKIERKNGGSDFSLIATLGADKILYKDSLLTPYTTYTYRVYSYNAAGESITYTNLDSATTNGVPLLTTKAIDSLGYKSAKSGGIITNSGGASVTAKGIVWSTTNTPSLDLATKTNDGVDTANYKSSMTGLTPGTIYNVWAYATNGKGTAFGNMVSFTTLALALPTIASTTATTVITNATAQSGGNITSDGGAAITSRGVCWGTTANPTTANSKTTDGTGIGAFTSSLIGLIAGTTYYVRSYATNTVGTAYGNEVYFNTTNVDVTSGLIAYYPFNGNANDESGNGNNGSVHGATLTTDRFGNINSAYSFDGFQEITAPNKSNLNITGNLTISGWFYSVGPPTFRTLHPIVTKRVSIGAGMPYYLGINYQYGINGNAEYKKPIFVSDLSYSDGYQYLQSSTDIINSKWSHLLCTINGNNLKMYLDGALALDTLINNSKRVANTGNLIIGGGARPDKPAEQIVGSLDEIRIYDRALTMDQITYLATH